MRIFSILTSFLLLLVFTSCDTDSALTTTPDADPVEMQSAEFEANVSIFDARVRSLSEENYVREVVLVNLADADRLPGMINFQNTVFLDNGAGNDQIAGDGVYTSVETYAHGVAVPYQSKQLVRSVLEAPIVDENFQQSTALSSVSADYDLRPKEKIFEITCDVEFGTKGCNAEQWGLCESCCVTVYTDTCSITVGF